MKLFDAMNDRYPCLSAAALSLGKEYDQLVEGYQSRWDQGDRFNLAAINPMNFCVPEAWKRDPENEGEDLTACLGLLASDIKARLLIRWAQRYSRDQMLTIINALNALDPCGSVRMWEMDCKYEELSEAWNTSHPAADPLQHTPSIEI